ncbi:MAG: hypothetical protein R3E01_19790 [Pirellulaceae bacterium]
MDRSEIFMDALNASAHKLLRQHGYRDHLRGEHPLHDEVVSRATAKYQLLPTVRNIPAYAKRCVHSAYVDYMRSTRGARLEYHSESSDHAHYPHAEHEQFLIDIQLSLSELDRRIFRTMLENPGSLSSVTSSVQRVLGLSRREARSRIEHIIRIIEGK